MEKKQYGTLVAEICAALKSYTKSIFATDLLAGITVGFVALPLAMAFDLASGVLPQADLYCAMVEGSVISAWGASTQIGEARL